jgi:DNA polymerase IV
VQADRVRKSVGAENTFARDLTTFEAMRDELKPLIDQVWAHCERSGIRGRTVTLKVKYADFQQITRSRSAPSALLDRAQLDEVSFGLLAQIFPVMKGVRLLGVTLSGLETERADAVLQMSLSL